MPHPPTLLYGQRKPLLSPQMGLCAGDPAMVFRADVEYYVAIVVVFIKDVVTLSSRFRTALFQDYFAYMSQPVGPTIPTPQSDHFQSLVNYWANWVTPNAWGHMCTDFWIDGDDVGILVAHKCLDTNLP